MTLLKRKRVFAAAVESTIGTPVSLGAGNGGFNAYEIAIQPAIEVEEREAQGSMDRLSGVSSARKGLLTFKTDMGWDGTTTMPTWASVLLPACGWVESSQVYTPRSEGPGTNVKTLTMGVYEDGVLKSIAGAVGTAKINLTSGKMGVIEWSFEGVWQPPTDTSLIAPTHPTASPIKFSSATVQLNSVDLCVANVTYDLGNTIVMRECASTEAGFISGIVTDRYPKITADPESVLVATQDRHGIWVANTEYEFETVLDGPTDSTITITAPKSQILNSQEGDREKLQIDQLELGCNKNGATKDESLKITFSEAT